MKVAVSFTVELDAEAQAAWMLEYGVSKEALRDDVRQYFTPDGTSYPEESLGVKRV